MNPLDDTELDAIEARCDSATPAPWRAWVEGRDGMSGDTFIGQGTDERGSPQRLDLYLSRYPGDPPVSAADHDFIAHARDDVPRLVAEVRRLRTLLDGKH